MYVSSWFNRLEAKKITKEVKNMKYDPVQDGCRQVANHASGATKKGLEVLAGGVLGSTFAAGATSGVLAVVGAPTTAVTVASGIGTALGTVASVSPAIASSLVLTAQVGVVAGALGVCLAPVAVVGFLGFAISKAIRG
jgi:hypothetical protein